MNDDLIFDIGANHGEDTVFYLAKGYRVVAVEANPILAELLHRQFRNEINAGRLVLETCGINKTAGVAKFYRNLTCDHWSSFVESFGARQKTDFEIVDVPCLTINDLL